MTELMLAAMIAAAEDAALVEPCVFCDIIAGREPAEIVHEWPDAIAVLPRRRWPEGHTLVVPKVHVRDALEADMVTLAVTARMLEIAERPCNLVFNCGEEAGMTVGHLHGHIIPGSPDLVWPWTGQAPYETPEDGRG